MSEDKGRKAGSKAPAEDEDEEVVQAKDGAMATVPETAVSSEVTVEGVTLSFPFLRIGQAMSQWRSEGRPPEIGAFYIGKDKQSNVKVGEAGVTGGVKGIILDIMHGYMEDKKFTGVANPPRRFFGPNALEDAVKAGLSLTPVPTGEVWPDTGNPVMRANISPYAVLHMLVPVDDGFPMDYQLFPIGGQLYTPARLEYSKQSYRTLNGVLGNVERVERYRHRDDPEWEMNFRGKVAHCYTIEQTSKVTGNPYPQLQFGLATRDGKQWEFTADERKDFVLFLQSVKATTVNASKVAETDESVEA